MRIDLVSIFPEYFAPLELSLPGKARDKGLVDIRVHDLRQWTHDRHHTTDDTPYGGGAGMVMKPEPWGEAFDELAIDEHTMIIVPTPSGEVFDQRMAEELSGLPRLVFCCGRYEGIDQRVVEYARELAPVREVSIGDYVLNGGEVAALAITEAVVRLIPGFMGNPESLVEESHEAGLLEYPSYTKPPSWRGRDVPDVLLSGDHARIAAWRRDQAVRRTAERRPDLAHPSRVEDGLQLSRATVSDAAELLTLQRACWVQEARANDTLAFDELSESMSEIEADIRAVEVWVARAGGRLVGSARGRLDGNVWHISRVMVAPDLQGRGIGRQLLAQVESVAPPSVTTYELHVATRSEANLRRYKRAGYRVRGELEGDPGRTMLTRPRDGRPARGPVEPAAAGPTEAPELPDGAAVSVATSEDAGEFMTLQWASFAPALREPLDVLARDITSAPTYLLRIDGRLVGAIRAEVHDQLCHLSLLMVAPDLHGRGLGRFLLSYAESQAPPHVTTYQVFTGADDTDNHAFYARAGYAVSGEQAPGVVRLTRHRTR